MLARTLEPEVMDTVADAVDYDAMDHSTVNRLFVDDFLRDAAAIDWVRGDAVPVVLDVGTGTARIPIELARRPFPCRIVGVDLAAEMLNLAERNVAAAGLSARIAVERIDAKRLPYDDGSFAAVVSNSIVHHIPHPPAALREMVRVTQSGGLLFVRDLLRPESVADLDRLVATYAGTESAHARQLFRDSLHAALALDEVRAMAIDCGLRPDSVRQTSDRHWTLSAVKD